MCRLVVAIFFVVVSGSVAAQVSSGTAFAVAPGLLITNQHVIAGCGSVEVIAADGRRTGLVLDADAQIDLALLRVSGIKGAPARLRSSRRVRLGESVMVFGFPLAGSLTSGGNFTSGLVSGLRGLRDAAGEIQITAPVQPGNSGGPLLDASGLVIGVVQAKLDALRSAIATGDIPQNVNFAISLEVLADFLVKNNVAFHYSNISKPLDTARVAELAQAFTYRVECRRKSRQAVIPPVTRPQPPPASARPAPTPRQDYSLVTPKQPEREEPNSIAPYPDSIQAEIDENLRDFYERGKKETQLLRKVEWYELAAKQGYAPAQFALSELLSSKGSSVFDELKAYEWLRKAADQGYAPAQRRLEVQERIGGRIK